MTPSARRFIIWTLIGGLAGVLGTLIVVAVMNRDPTPALTPAAFEAAHRRWQAVAPANYDIEVRVKGPQAALYRVEVRGGEARAAWRNGQSLTSQRTFGTWSVPGMFSTMSRDVETVERQAAGRDRSAGPPLLLRASFDAQFSYPERYRRIEWGSRKGSDAVAVMWEVADFRVYP